MLQNTFYKTLNSTEALLGHVVETYFFLVWTSEIILNLSFTTEQFFTSRYQRRSQAWAWVAPKKVSPLNEIKPISPFWIGLMFSAFSILYLTR